MLSSASLHHFLIFNGCARLLTQRRETRDDAVKP
ncbi:uncharacterized protein G2W53_033147 [Senna tora]|uniref:Uncharacterized protein n=1 Tax=Senna tora TaxID=362788 RepID=A0A834SYR1_9FABA|nr:uncharacterized protein G2W53_033147 [Senna tora]